MTPVGLRYLPRAFLRVLMGLALLAALAAIMAPLAWSQALDKPMLVVAKASQDEGPWRRAVMLALPFQGRHIGVILNRPTTMTMGKVFPDDAAAQNVAEPVYVGGPVNSRAIVALVKGEKPGPRSVAVDAGVWLVLTGAEIDAVLSKTPNAARYYLGFVLWEAGELREEVKRGWMAVLPLDPGKLFRPDTSTLYDELNRGSKLET